MTRVRADMNLCQINGQCGLVAPEISDLGDGVLRWRIDATAHPERPARAVVAA